MRVLLINKYHYVRGGAERAYLDTARILTEKGHTVAFFSMHHPDNLETPWSRFFVSPVDYHDGRMSLFDRMRVASKILWNFEAARKLEALIQEFHPEVAHLHNIYHQLSPSIIWTLKKHRVRMVMTLHDYKLVSPNYSLLVRGEIWEHTSGFRTVVDRAVQDSFVKSFLCAAEQWWHAFLGSYRQIDVFIAPSHFLIEKFHRLGFPSKIAHVVQPLVPFPESPVNVGGGYLLFVGRLSQGKGVETLIEAMRLLGPGEKLKIVGTGPERVVLRTAAADLSSVEFLGYQTGEAWETSLRGAKALILPSLWYENMPYVVLEALARGKPVIASNIGGVPERVQEGVNGFLFEAGNAAALAEKVKRLSQADGTELVRRAYESVSDTKPEQYYRALMRYYTAGKKLV